MSSCIGIGSNRIKPHLFSISKSRKLPWKEVKKDIICKAEANESEYFAKEVEKATNVNTEFDNSDEGWTLLSYAVEYAKNENDLYIISKLLDAGADPNKLPTDASNVSSPLAKALELDNRNINENIIRSIIQKLLARKANINAILDDMVMYLHDNDRFNYFITPIVESILKYGLLKLIKKDTIKTITRYVIKQESDSIYLKLFAEANLMAFNGDIYKSVVVTGNDINYHKYTMAYKYYITKKIKNNYKQLAYAEFSLIKNKTINKDISYPLFSSKLQLNQEMVNRRVKVFELQLKLSKAKYILSSLNGPSFRLTSNNNNDILSSIDKLDMLIGTDLRPYLAEFKDRIIKKHLKIALSTIEFIVESLNVTNNERATNMAKLLLNKTKKMDAYKDVKDLQQNLMQERADIKYLFDNAKKHSRSRSSSSGI